MTEKDVYKRQGDFSLGREGFTGTGSTQNQPVGVFELFPVNHNQVVGQSIQPVSYTHLDVYKRQGL